MNALRDEWLVDDAEVLGPDGQDAREPTHAPKTRAPCARGRARAFPRHCEPGDRPRGSAASAAVTAGRQASHHRGRRARSSALGFVRILVPLEVLYPDWRSYLLITLAAIAAAVLTAYWLAARLQQQISGPIVNLAHTMQRVSVGRRLQSARRAQFPRRSRLADRRLQSNAGADPASRLAAGEVPPVPRAASRGAHDQFGQCQPGA